MTIHPKGEEEAIDRLEVKNWNNFMAQLPAALTDFFNILKDRLKIEDVIYSVVPSYNHYKVLSAFRPRPGHYPEKIRLFLQRSW